MEHPAGNRTSVGECAGRLQIAATCDSGRVRRRQKPPLPQRHGLDPARLRMPVDGHWATIREHLVERLQHRVPAQRIDEWLDDERIVDLDGPITRDAPYVPGGAVWLHRDLPDETPVPFGIDVLYRDDTLLVVDKPHFLATIPRGQHILIPQTPRLPASPIRDTRRGRSGRTI